MGQQRMSCRCLPPQIMVEHLIALQVIGLEGNEGIPLSQYVVSDDIRWEMFISPSTNDFVSEADRQLFFYDGVFSVCILSCCLNTGPPCARLTMTLYLCDRFVNVENESAGDFDTDIGTQYEKKLRGNPCHYTLFLLRS